jgi:YD repeat-containing protein
MVSIFTGLGSGFERGSAAQLGSAGLLGSGAFGRSGEQLSLNAATGNFLISQRDDFLAGQGIDSSIVRTYNSLGDLSDDNHDNWRQSTQRHVYGSDPINTAGSTIHRVSADGSDITYSYQTRTVAGGSSVTAYWAADGSGAFDKLTYASSTWTWTDGDSQYTETYEAAGTNDWRIKYAADNSGNALTFSYNSNGTLDKVSTANGEYEQYSWSSGNITQIVTGYTDFDTSTATTLTRTRYGYDSSNRLTSVTVDKTPDDNSVSDGATYVTTYTYDGTSNRVATIAETDGSAISITYDGSGRITGLSQTVASGVTRATSIVYNSGYTTVTDQLGQVTRLDYDGSNQLTKITAPPAVSGGSPQVTQFGYDTSGNVTSVTDALGGVTSFTYDGVGNCATLTDSMSRVRTFTDSLRNPTVLESWYTSSPLGPHVLAADRYVYDSNNRLIFVVDSVNHVTQLTYDSTTGYLLSKQWFTQNLYTNATAAISASDMTTWLAGISDKSNVENTAYTYDARGNLAYERTHDAATSTGAPDTTKGYRETHYVYDQAGQLLRRTVTGLNTEYFHYDGLGRLTASTDINTATTNIVFTDSATQTVVTFASGLVQTSTYDKAGALISFNESGSDTTVGTATNVYDGDGQLRFATDATGRKSYFLYDHAGRKTADIDQDGNIVEYRYDAGNRLSATIRYASAVSSTTGLQTLSISDVAAILPTPAPGDMWTWTIYNAMGSVVETIGGDGSVTTFDYDEDQRATSSLTYAAVLTSGQLATIKTTLPTSAVLPAADASNDRFSRIAYNKAGDVIEALDGEGSLVGFNVDGAGHVINDNLQGGLPDPSLWRTGAWGAINLSAGTTNPATRTTRYVYDGQGNLRYQIDTLGYVTEYVYAGASTTSSIGDVRSVIRYAHALTGTPATYTVATVAPLVSPDSTLDRTSYAVYDAANRLAFAIDATGAVSAYGYDTYGRLIKATQYSTRSTTTTLPSLSDMTTWVAGHTDTTNDRVSRTYYNARSEVRYTVDAEGFVTKFDYDAEGRATGTTRWDTGISVSDSTTLGGVAAAVSGTCATTVTAYDNDGRIQSTTDGEGHVSYFEYNHNGTLAASYAAYATGDQVKTGYDYDNAGRVTKRTDAMGATEQRITQFFYDGLGNKWKTIDADGNTTLYSYDRMGRLKQVTNALSGTTSYQYNVFGEAVKVTDANGNASYSYYDNLGQVIRTRDAENYITESSYNVFGELASVTRRYNATTDAVSTTTLPTATPDTTHDATTSFEYDGLGRITKVIDPEIDPTVSGGTTHYYEQYTYTALGQKLTVRNKLGAVTNNVYDRRGLLVQETLPISSITASGITQATSVINKFGYDARGNRTSMTEAYGLTEQRITTYVYDKVDQLIETHLPAVLNSTGSANINPVEYVAYDARGNVIQQTDAAGARTLFYYDQLGRQKVAIGPTGTYSATSYALGGGTNGGAVTSRTYDVQITLPTTPGGTPPSAPTTGSYRESVSTYDKLGRLSSTSMANVRTGSWNATTSVYSTSPVTVTSSWEYDADGNVIKATDANGGLAYSYYDKLGRKTAQVDTLGYLTSWTRDAEGNTLSERRYATAATGTLTTTAPPTVSTVAADRVTNFTYDRNGNRLTEARTGLDYYTINTSSGALTLVSGGTATITYTYNGIGEVLTKAEATGDTTSYTYDAAGRLMVESRQSYLDYTSTTTTPVTDTPTVRYFYDGLGDLTRSTQGGATAASGDRVTKYTYGAGGRLISMTDPANYVHAYYYDAVGRKIGDAYDRLKADGTTTVHEGISYQYDAAGQMTRQAFATVSSGTFTDAGDVTTLAYNAYGEVTGRGLNGVTQEQRVYDNAGHLIASNGGNGAWKYFLYDANGNQTAEIDDEGKAGVNLVNQSLSTVLGIATAGSTTIGATYIDGINVTITVYDARNQAITAIQTKRQLTETGTPVDLTSHRTYNAFGETLTEANALTYTTTYTYNTVGKAVTVQHAAVSVGNADGTVTTGVTPTDTYFYDISGRMIGQQDAKGHRNSRLLLAGTGYGQTTALLAKEFHPDGGVVQKTYDLFGDQRVQIDEIGRMTTMVYDALDRVTQVNHAGGLVDNYVSDVLGQRTRHTRTWNNAGTTQVDLETTDYDVQGRVTSQVAFGGDATTNSYSWSGTLVTTGMNGGVAFGGYTQTTTYANGKTVIEATDGFGHIISHTDMGSHTTNVTYDTAGRLVERAGGDTQRYNYLNTGLAGSVSSGTGTGTGFTETAHATYGYDAIGEKLSEYATNGATVIENATATYDAMGRMITWAEIGGSVTTPAASLAWSYDAVGNVRHETETYYGIQSDGTAYSTSITENFWYRYDAMNRVTTDHGELSGTSIVRGMYGTDLCYDAAGQRHTATTDKYGIVGEALVWVPYTDGEPGYHDPLPIEPGVTGDYVPQDRYYNGVQRETYTYDDAGNLTAVAIVETGYTDNGDGTITAHSVLDRSIGGGSYTFDALGRMIHQIDTVEFGANVFDHHVYYDSKGRVWKDETSQLQGTDTFITTTLNYFSDGTSGYVLGAVTSSTSGGTKLHGGVSSSIPSTSTVMTYAWYDGAVQSQVDYNPDTSGSTVNHTNYYYTGSGTFSSAHVDDGRTRDITATNDILGQVIRRDEADGNGSLGDPHQSWYRFNGKQIGSNGNNNTFDNSYDGSLTDRTHIIWGGPGAFRYGMTGGLASAEFNDHLVPINTWQQGSAGGSYTVRDGDTLSSIAGQLWGDSALWYKLAQANGMSSDTGLVAGRTLVVPSGVIGNYNSASTFKPYDASLAYGDTSPTTPQPQATKNKCGIFGQILVAIVAVAVTMITAPILGPLAPIVGDLAGQGTANALGMQHGVNWNEVGRTAVHEVFTTTGGMLGDAEAQGISIALGLQDKFDWGEVAADAVLSLAQVAIPGGVPEFNKPATAFAAFGQRLVANTAKGLISASVRSLVNGTDFGDSLRAALPNILAQAAVDGFSSFAQGGVKDIGNKAKDDALGTSGGAIAPGNQAPGIASATGFRDDVGFGFQYITSPDPDDPRRWANLGLGGMDDLGLLLAPVQIPDDIPDVIVMAPPGSVRAARDKAFRDYASYHYTNGWIARDSVRRWSISTPSAIGARSGRQVVSQPSFLASFASRISAGLNEIATRQADINLQQVAVQQQQADATRSALTRAGQYLSSPSGRGNIPRIFDFSTGDPWTDYAQRPYIESAFPNSRGWRPITHGDELNVVLAVAGTAAPALRAGAGGSGASSAVGRIASRLDRLGYDVSNTDRIVQAVQSGDQIVVVGENMRRVDAVAKMVNEAGGSAVTYAPRNWGGLSRKSLEANRSWLRYWTKDKGATVIDIGRQATPRVTGPSPFYGVENRSLHSWNIYTPF